MNPTTNTEARAVADVAAIAAWLTKAQRRVILAFPPEPRTYLEIGWPRTWSEIVFRARCARASIQVCVGRGLVGQPEWRGQDEFRHLTPLGLAVRQHLSEQGATAGEVEGD